MAAEASTRIFLWRFVAETDEAVKNVNKLHAVARGAATHAEKVVKRQHADHLLATKEAKVTAKTTVSTIGSLAALGTALAGTYYTLKKIFVDTATEASRITRVFAIMGDTFDAANAKTQDVVEGLSRLGNLAMPELVDATVALATAGVKGTDALVSLAAQSVMTANLMGVSATEMAQHLGRLTVVLGMNEMQVKRHTAAMVALSRYGGEAAKTIMLIAQNTIYASQVTGIAVDKFMALGVAFQRMGFTAAQSASAVTELADALAEYGGGKMAAIVGNINEFNKAMNLEDPTKAIGILDAGVARFGDNFVRVAHQSLGLSKELAVALYTAHKAGNMTEVVRIMKVAAAAQKDMETVTKRYNEANANLVNGLKIVWDNLKKLGMVTMSYLMPVLTALITPLKWLSMLINKLPAPVKVVIGLIFLLALGVVALVAAAGTLAFLWPYLMSGMVEGIVAINGVTASVAGLTAGTLTLSAVAAPLTMGLTAVSVAVWNLTVAILANPIGLIVAGVIALFLACFGLYKMLTATNPKIKALGVMLAIAFFPLTMIILQIVLLVKAIKWLWAIGQAVFEGIWQVVDEAFQPIRAAIDEVMMLVDVIKSQLQPVFAIFEEIFGPSEGFLKTVSKIAGWLFKMSPPMLLLRGIVQVIVFVLHLVVGALTLVIRQVSKVVSMFVKLWGIIKSGSDMAKKVIHAITHPFESVGKAAGQLKKKLFGSGFLHIAEGVLGAMNPLMLLLKMFNMVGNAAEQMHKKASGEVAVGPVGTPTAGAGAAGAAGVAGGKAGKLAPIVIRAGGGSVKFGDITIPITLLLDGTVVAETIVKVGKDQLMRMHGLPRRTMRGVPALGG